MDTFQRSFLPYGRHVVDSDDIASVVAVLQSDWLTTGPVVDSFEAAFAERVGARYAVACSSATAGLHLAMLAADLSPGDLAVVPTITFLATANAVRYVGGEVVFADVDAETALLGPGDLRAAIEKSAGMRPRAVLPVHMAGQCVDLPALRRIADEAGMLVIEDASHAIGATYLDEQGTEVAVGACRHSDMAVFSFHPVKTVAMGEGGMVTTNDPGLAERLRRFRSHGMTREPSRLSNGDLAFTKGELNPWYYEMPEIGFNYRASDIHCALGLSQLHKLDRFVAKRRDLVALYRAKFERLGPTMRAAAVSPASKPAWHLFVGLFDFPALGIDRASLMNRLREDGIGTQVHYIPVHSQPYYRRRYPAVKLPNAQAYYDRCLSLPLFADMGERDVERVVKALLAAVGDVRHRASREPLRQSR